MKEFKWFKAIGLGALVWLIVFAVTSALVGFSVLTSVWMEAVVALIAGLVAYILASNLNEETNAAAFAYGLVFAVVGIALDAIISMRFAPDMFASLAYWAGYVLVFFAPLLELHTRGERKHVII